MPCCSTNVSRESLLQDIKAAADGGAAFKCVGCRKPVTDKAWLKAPPVNADLKGALEALELA